MVTVAICIYAILIILTRKYGNEKYMCQILLVSLMSLVLPIFPVLCITLAAVCAQIALKPKPKYAEIASVEVKELPAYWFVEDQVVGTKISIKL